MPNERERESKHVRIERSPWLAGPAPQLLAIQSIAFRRDWTAWLEEAVREVFELILNEPLGRCKRIVFEEEFDLCAMVGLAGDICGMLSLRGSNVCGAKIASAMLGSEVAEGENSVLDALGEVCNMIAVNFKAKIPGIADGCLLSDPTVIEGKDYVVHSMAESERIRLVLEFGRHPFSITLDLHSPLLS